MSRAVLKQEASEQKSQMAIYEQLIESIELDHNATLKDIFNIYKVKKQPVFKIQTDTSQNNPSASSNDAAKLSCEFCGFETPKTKPSKARQKMQAHIHAKHPQLDEDVILGDRTVSLGDKEEFVRQDEASNVILDTLEEVSNQISDQDHLPL